MKNERSPISPATAWEARLGLSTLMDVNDPSIPHATLSNTITQLDLMTVGMEQTALPQQATVYAMDTAHRLLRRRQIPGVGRRDGKEIRRALRDQKAVMRETDQSISQDNKMDALDVLRYFVTETGLDTLIADADEITTMAHATLLVLRYIKRGGRPHYAEEEDKRQLY